MDDPIRKPSRPFIGIHFKCCNVYSRILLTADGKAYAGHCPRCARAIRIKTAPGGDSSKFWSAG